MGGDHQELTFLLEERNLSSYWHALVYWTVYPAAFAFRKYHIYFFVHKEICVVQRYIGQGFTVIMAAWYESFTVGYDLFPIWLSHWHMSHLSFVFKEFPFVEMSQ